MSSLILMSFDNIEREEKKANFTFKKKKYTISVTMNPFSRDVLCSIFLGREAIVLNRVAVLYEPIIGIYGADAMDQEVNAEFVFLPDDIKSKYRANKIPVNALGKGIELYAIDREEYYEN